MENKSKKMAFQRTALSMAIATALSCSFEYAVAAPSTDDIQSTAERSVKSESAGSLSAVEPTVFALQQALQKAKNKEEGEWVDYQEGGDRYDVANPEQNKAALDRYIEARRQTEAAQAALDEAVASQASAATADGQSFGYLKQLFPEPSIVERKRSTSSWVSKHSDVSSEREELDASGDKDAFEAIRDRAEQAFLDVVNCDKNASNYADKLAARDEAMSKLKDATTSLSPEFMSTKRVEAVARAGVFLNDPGSVISSDSGSHHSDESATELDVVNKKIQSLEKGIKDKAHRAASVHQAVQSESKNLDERIAELSKAQNTELNLRAKCIGITSVIDEMDAIIIADIADRLPENAIDVRKKQIEKNNQLHHAFVDRVKKDREEELERLRGSKGSTSSAVDKSDESQSLHETQRPSVSQPQIEPQRTEPIQRVRLIESPTIKQFVPASLPPAPPTAEQEHENLLQAAKKVKSDVDATYKKIEVLNKKYDHLTLVLADRRNTLDADYSGEQSEDPLAATVRTNILNDRFVRDEADKRKEELSAWNQHEYLSVANKVKELNAKANSLKDEKLSPRERLIKAFGTTTTRELAAKQEVEQRKSEMHQAIGEAAEERKEDFGRVTLVPNSSVVPSTATRLSQRPLPAASSALQQAPANVGKSFPAVPTEQELQDMGAALAAASTQQQPQPQPNVDGRLPAPPTPAELQADIDAAAALAQQQPQANEDELLAPPAEGVRIGYLEQLERASNKRIVDAISTTLHGSQQLMAHGMRSTLSQVANHSTESGIATGDTLSVDGMWLSYLHSNGKQKGDDSLKDYSNKLDGVTVGVEGEFAPDTIVGAAFTAAKSSVNVKAESPASTKSDFYAVTVYGNRTQGNWIMNSALSYGMGSHDHKLAGEKASSKTKALGLSVGGGYNYALNGQWTLQPSTEFNLINIHGDDVKAKDIKVSASGLKVTELGAGIKLVGEIPMEKSTLTTEMGLKHFHNFTSKDLSGSVNSTVGSQKLTGIKNQRDRGVANFGVGYDLTNDLALGLGYDYDFSHGYKSNSVKAKLSYQF